MLFTIAGKQTPATGGNGSAYKRAYDEYPKLRKGFAAFKESGADGAGGIDRSARVVDADKVDEDEGKAYGKARKVVGRTVGLAGSTEHYEHEDEREEYFSYESVHDVVRSASIGSRVGALGKRRVSAYEHGKERCGNDGTDDLCHDVAYAVLSAHSSGKEHAKADGGIDVATGNSANGVGHGYNGKAEGKGGTYYGRCVNSAVEANGSTAAEKREHEGAEKFCKILFHSEELIYGVWKFDFWDGEMCKISL